MSIFDSPIARCEAIREMVLTDETQAECAREHECPPGRVCPLCGYFVEESPAPELASENPTPSWGYHWPNAIDGQLPMPSSARPKDVRQWHEA